MREDLAKLSKEGLTAFINNAGKNGNPTLSGANLSGANLNETNLNGARGICRIGAAGMSSRGDDLYAVVRDRGFMIKAGCFWGTDEQFEVRVLKKKGEGHLYLAALTFLRAWYATQSTQA